MILRKLMSQGKVTMGKQSLEWVQQFGQLPEAAVAVTDSGTTECKYFVHIHSPMIMYSGAGTQAEKIGRAMGNLRTSMFNILSTVSNVPQAKVLALPPISCSQGGLSMEKSAQAMINNIVNWCITNKTGHLQSIRIVCFKDEEQQKFLKYMTDNFFKKK